MKLHEIVAPKHTDTKRLGRGIGSGSGKTSGRGTKGQNSRTGGGVKIGFEGGQTKLSRRLPKARGFKALAPNPYQVVSLDQLEKIGKAQVDKTVLAAAGMISVKKPAKLLSNGILKSKVTVTIDAASAGAIKAVESAGGKVILPEKVVKISKKNQKETAQSNKEKTTEATVEKSTTTKKQTTKPKTQSVKPTKK